MLDAAAEEPVGEVRIEPIPGRPGYHRASVVLPDDEGPPQMLFRRCSPIGGIGLIARSPWRLIVAGRIARQPDGEKLLSLEQAVMTNAAGVPTEVLLRRRRELRDIWLDSFGDILKPEEMDRLIAFERGGGR